MNTSAKEIIRDAALILSGSFIYALGVDCFQIPFDIAAGGITGLATVIHAVLINIGIDFPIGMQTIIFNMLLMIPVLKSGGLKYAIRTLAGIFASGFFLDILSPLVPVLEGYDLFVAVLWGGFISGIGLGLVFRSGGNTGGTDIIAQLISKRTSLPVGFLSICCDAVVVLISIPVFGFRNALYAIICMTVMGKTVDFVIEGPKTERAAYIISEKHEAIAEKIMYTMGRGCTEFQARGVWSGNNKPVLFVVLGIREITQLKTIVAKEDSEAIVIISDVHEAFGEGFKHIGT